MATKTKTDLQSTETELAIDAIIPDPANRDVAAEAAANGDEWQQLVDSIRVRGVIQRVEVCDRGDNTYDLIDGERRWRASQAAGLSRIPARIWPMGTARAELVELGLIINVQRREHGCLEIARRLRELKNQYALTVDQLGQRTGLAPRKVECYLTLFHASDDLLTFFAEEAVPLRVAVEVARFHKRYGDAASRRLIAQARQEPLTIALVQAARKRLDAAGGDKAPDAKPAGEAKSPRAPSFIKPLVTAVERDEAATAAAVQAALAPRGYHLVSAGQAGAAFLAELEALVRRHGGSLVSPSVGATS
jgi:ParB/RepB/Spo0J family partition protein